MRRSPGFDIVRAQDVSAIAGKDDLVLLTWATKHDRIVMTHDLATMVPATRLRLQRGSQCAPVVLIPDSLATGIAIDDVLLLDECSAEADWATGVIHLPLR